MKMFVLGSLAFLAILLGEALRGSITTVPEDNPGRANLIEWLKSNYRGGAETKFGQQIIHAVDDALMQDKNVEIALGPALAKSGKPTGLLLFDANFFAFEYSDDVAQRRGAQDAKTAITYFPAPEELNGVQLFELSDLQFDDADQVDRNGPLSGSVKFKILVPSKGKFGLRLWYRGTANTDSEMSYFRAEGTLPEAGRLHFDFRPFAKSDTAKDIQGPVRLYITLCNEAYRNRRTTQIVCSNVVEQVVNVPSE